MKRYFIRMSTILSAIFALASCSGPQGIPGRDGENGQTTISETLEVQANFLPEYEYTEEITLNPPIIDGDAIFVYWLSSEKPDVWRPLPYTVYFEDGNELDYTFDYALSNVQIYLGFTHRTPPSDFCLNQIFRIVILPSLLIQNSTELDKDRLQSMDYNELTNTLKNSNIKFKERIVIK